MKVSRLKIAEVISERTLKSYDSKALAKEVAAYLLSTGRVDELDSLIRDIIDYRAEKGLLEVGVSSAHQLDDGLRKEVKQLVKSVSPKANTISLDETVAPNLIGGLKLKIANQQLDLSLRAKLNRFKQLTN
ncbi:MAG TPA: F0F1 ATP synthase subunit delta [Candidatus Saccharimonadales bacterium]